MNTDQFNFTKSNRTYEDLGLTKEDFLEIVDFFQELMKLDELDKNQTRLVQVLRARFQQMIIDREKSLRSELTGLEQLKRKF